MMLKGTSQRCRDFREWPALSPTMERFSSPTAARQVSPGSTPLRFKTKAMFKTGARPNGAAIVSRTALGIVACIGDEREAPTLQSFGLNNRKQVAIDLPGRPRWCVTDASAERVFLCIREPSMVLVAGLPDLNPIAQWKLPSGGAHGLDIDHSRGRLYAACDDGALVEIDSGSGEVTNVWPIAGPPDVTFFNPSSGLVHVAIGEPGLVETIDPRTGSVIRTMTGAGRAHNGLGTAGPSLCDFTQAWRNSCPGG